MKSLLTFALIALLQNPPEPRINRDEDLRRQSEAARLRREEDQKKFLEARRLREFQENAGKFMPLAREACSPRGSMLAKDARKTVSGGAKKMDGVVARIIEYLGYKQKPPKAAATSPTEAVLDQFCGQAREIGLKLDKLIESSQKGPWSAELAEESSKHLQSLRELLQILKKL